MIALGPNLLGLLEHMVVLNQASFVVDPVEVRLEEPAGEVDILAVGQVPALGEVQAEDAVARVQRARRYAARLALAPECGCTLACSAPKSSFARSMASTSTSSTYSQPP